MQGNARGPAEALKYPDGGLQQPQTAVVAVPLDVVDQFSQTAEHAIVAFVGQDLHFRGLPQGDLGAEVAEDKGDGLAAEAIGGVTDQGGAGVGTGGDDHGVVIVGLGGTAGGAVVVRTRAVRQIPDGSRRGAGAQRFVFWLVTLRGITWRDISMVPEGW